MQFFLSFLRNFFLQGSIGLSMKELFWILYDYHVVKRVQLFVKLKLLIKLLK